MNLWVSLPQSHPGIIVRCAAGLDLSSVKLTYDSYTALHNAWSPILAGIFAGNGVVLKCSENVIWSTAWFVGAIQEALRVCGHDPELVQLVCCYPDDAPALTRSPEIKHITFIGSEPIGKKVYCSVSLLSQRMLTCNFSLDLDCARCCS